MNLDLPPATLSVMKDALGEYTVHIGTESVSFSYRNHPLVSVALEHLSNALAVEMGFSLRQPVFADSGSAKQTDLATWVPLFPPRCGFATWSADTEDELTRLRWGRARVPASIGRLQIVNAQLPTHRLTEPVLFLEARGDEILLAIELFLTRARYFRWAAAQRAELPTEN